MQRFLNILASSILLLAAVFVGLVLYVIAVTDRFIYSSIETMPEAETALVLGASVSSKGELSPVLQERADAAARLYVAHTVKKILVSGDDSTLEYNEVFPIGKYLKEKGIPEKDIFLDYAGFDTYSSMYRARDVFAVHSMIITTQRFHLPRALYIAHRLGIDARGIDAGVSGGRYLSNSLREIPATLKALFDLASHRVPKFLGMQFPISGSASETWLGSGVEMIYFTHGN